MIRLPLLTIGLCLLACALMALPADIHETLYFNRPFLTQGVPLGLVSGHWVHADTQHLIWNVSALGILAAVIESRSRTLLLASIGIGMLCVDLLLLSPLSALQRYCGLSGLLNTLFGVVLFLKWRESRSPIVLCIGTLAVLKIALEMVSGQSVFTDISWPPYAASHLAGLLGAPLAIGVCCRKRQAHFHSIEQERRHHGNLVTSQ